MSTAVFESLWAEYGNVVEGIAATYGRKNRAYGAGPEDFSHEAVCWMLENQDALAFKVESLEPAEFTKYLARCIENECRDYQTDIKAQALGYERQDNYFYTKGELKHLLGCVFDKEKWLEPPQSDGRSTKRPAEGNNWVVTLADIASAFEKLGSDDQELLRDIHEKGWRNKDLAELNGVTEATMSYRHGRAVTRLQRHLGGPAPSPARPASRDPWRGRHAVSNAHAMAMTAANYEES